MLLRLILFVPLLRQFMLLEELCELDGPVWVSNTVNGVKETAKAAARRVPWRDARMVNTSATIRLKLGPFYKLVSAQVCTLDVTHGGGTSRYYLTRRGKLYEGYLNEELRPVDLTQMNPNFREQLVRTLDQLHR
jgi:hypothetical protein